MYVIDFWTHTFFFLGGARDLIYSPIPGIMWKFSFTSLSTAVVTILTFGNAYATVCTPKYQGKRTLISLIFFQMFFDLVDRTVSAITVVVPHCLICDTLAFL